MHKMKFSITYPAYSASAETREFSSRAAALAHARALGASRGDFLHALDVLARDERRYTVGRTLPAASGMVQVRYVRGHVGDPRTGVQWWRDVVRTTASRAAPTRKRYALS